MSLKSYFNFGPDSQSDLKGISNYNSNNTDGDHKLSFNVSQRYYSIWDKKKILDKESVNFNNRLDQDSDHTNDFEVLDNCQVFDKKKLGQPNN